MSFEVRTTSRFERAVKTLLKRHRSLKSDLETLISSLEKDPTLGDELTPGVRKVRMAITSKGKGKSGGARVITYTIIASENHGRVYLLDIYDKSDYNTVDTGKIMQVIQDLKL